MHRQLTSTLLACLLTLCLHAGAASPASEDAAWQWLALIDECDYASAWEQSGSLMRDSLDQAALAQAIDMARSNLGELGKRDLVGTEQTRRLPGVEDGNYIVFSFLTGFGDDTLVTETLTMSLE
ncbi:MAG: DUF4019 domain-containing protein, partial [Pseudomonadaceae bacterium]